MNILPKKRWHVRTKDNIARVRRDEAAAREEEEKRVKKLKFAESEARINFLRKKATVPETGPSPRPDEESNALTPPTSAPSSEHVELFADFKSHIKQTNKEHEREEKTEREKYEKQIGYLTYLGQDTNEALKLRSWYEVAPKRKLTDDIVVERDLKNKYKHDPLTLIKTLLPPEKEEKKTPNAIVVAPTITAEPVVFKREKESPDQIRKRKKKKEKKQKKSHKSSKRKKDKRHRRKDETSEEDEDRAAEMAAYARRKQEMLEKLRKERLHREARERMREEELLSADRPPKTPVEKQAESGVDNRRIVQKYNSQFNPDIAKQNMT